MSDETRNVHVSGSQAVLSLRGRLFLIILSSVKLELFEIFSRYLECNINT